jgi:hypothetical protein
MPVLLPSLPNGLCGPCAHMSFWAAPSPGCLPARMPGPWSAGLLARSLRARLLAWPPARPPARALALLPVRPSARPPARLFCLPARAARSPVRSPAGPLVWPRVCPPARYRCWTFRRAAEKKFALSLRELAEVTPARERQQQREISSEVQTGCQVLLRDTFDAAKDMKGTGSHQRRKTMVATCLLSCLATPCSALRIEVTHVQSASRSMTTATLPVCCICLTISVCEQRMLSN